jgi:uncharacterized protein (TIGR02231 family)
MRRAFILMSLLFICGVVYANDSKNISLNSSIQSVIVFSDRAMVTRQAGGTFTEGAITIEIPHLPSGLVNESIHVSGKGTAGCKIDGVKVEQSLADSASPQRIQEVEKQRDELDNKTAVLNDRSELLKLKAEFIQSLSHKTSESISNNLPKERPTVSDWGGMLKFVDDGLESINKENRSIAAELKDIQVKHQVLDAKLGEIRQGGASTEKEALIEISIDKPGSFNFEISYMIGGASWYPIYDVRSWSDTNEIELAYMAMVNQQTGEDWDNVSLELSTARPAAGANPPTISAWYLSEYEPHYMNAQPSDLTSTEKAGRQQAWPNPFNAPILQNSLIVAENNAAEVASQGVSTTFAIKQRESIPSNKEQKKVPINIVKFTASEEYITVPKYSEIAYLKSAVANTTDIPLLAGATNIFYDNNFVSNGSLPLVLPKENFNLYFGADEGIKVKRELVEKQKDDVGITGKKERISYEYKITLQNYHNIDCNISIVDQIPISQNDDIEVKLGNLSPVPQYKEGDQQKGYLRWIIRLKPQEKSVIDYKYQVKYPGGMTIYRLE